VVKMLEWQLRFMARFLEAAAEKASWVSVKQDENTLTLVAANEREDRLTQLVVTTKPPYTLTYTDEWGLLE
jgi:hypothetical protein